MVFEGVLRSFDREPHIISRFNYNNIWNSLMSTFLIFFNEEWQLFPFDYSHYKGKVYVLYFVVIVLFFQLILMKMFSALLINKFCGSASIKFMIKSNHNLDYFSLDFWKKKIKTLYDETFSKKKITIINKSKAKEKDPVNLLFL